MSLDEQFGIGAEKADAEARSQCAILDEIVKEREYQDRKWGTAFDDKNTINDWGAYLGIYLARGTNMTATPQEQRAALVKVATLAVAALECFDRNSGFPPRHYDAPKALQDVFLARREKGKRIWVYPMRSSYLRDRVWEFTPPPACNLVRNGFSGPGVCALAPTAAEARELLVSLELLQ